MPPKRKPPSQMPIIFFPVSKKSKKNNDIVIDNIDEYFDDEEYLDDEDFFDELEFEEEDDYDDDDDDDDDDDGEEEEEEDDDSDDSDDSDDLEDDEEAYQKIKNQTKKDKEYTLKSNKWINDEFTEEASKFNIENNIRLKIKINIHSLYEKKQKISDDEIEIVNNNMSNIGIILLNNVYENNKKKSLSKILSAFDGVIDGIEKKKRNSSSDKSHFFYKNVMGNCEKIHRKFKSQILSNKKKEDFDFNEFIKDNYDSELYDKRITTKLLNKYDSVEVDMDTKKSLKKLSTEEKKQYYDKMETVLDSVKNDKSYYLEILDKEGLDDESKVVILKKIKEMENADSHDNQKLYTWISKIKSIPFGTVSKMQVSKNDKQKNIQKFLENASKCMEDSISGHDKVKKELMRTMGKFVMNNCENGNVIALEGPPGVGKTELIKNGLSKAMNLPCAFIPLGGLTDSAYLHGHDYTYTGSDHGKIIDILKQTKHMNPIIFFDELDKVSKCHKGDEIMNILIQLTDPTQNKDFQDKYFRGINFDLSKCLVIFSFNSRENISPILLNRMNIIRLESLKETQKVKIAQKFLIPSIMKDSKIDNFELDLSDELIRHISSSYTYEGGVRKLKDRLTEIILEINVRKLMGQKIGNAKIGNKVVLTEDIVDNDLLKDRMKITHDKKCKEYKVGRVNGMWANDLGVGGILSIQCDWVPSEKKLSLELTGMQGKVMKESMSVAKTIAWKLIPENIKKGLYEKWKESDSCGIHIHAFDGSTPKDGPSAGIILTLALVSLFTGIKCNPDISTTGEINMNGESKIIGGLDNKFFGAKAEGIKLSLYPEENQRDVDEILANHPDLIDDTYQIKSYKNIYEAMDHILESQLDWNLI
jgi:ATP-dependent Lon protease